MNTIELVSHRSHRKCSQPSARSKRPTNATWLVSIACNEMPAFVQSKLASVTSSFQKKKPQKKKQKKQKKNKKVSALSPIFDIYQSHFNCFHDFLQQ
jgi:hypothetical protein